MRGRVGASFRGFSPRQRGAALLPQILELKLQEEDLLLQVLHQLGLHIVVAAVTGGKLVGSLDGRGGGGYKCCRPDRAPLLWTERSRAAADGRRPADQLQILARHGFLDDRSLEFTRELKIA